MSKYYITIWLQALKNTNTECRSPNSHQTHWNSNP